MLEPSFDDLLGADVPFNRNDWVRRATTLAAITPHILRNWREHLTGDTKLPLENGPPGPKKASLMVQVRVKIDGLKDRVTRYIKQSGSGSARSPSNLPNYTQLDKLVVDRRTLLLMMVLHHESEETEAMPGTTNSSQPLGVQSNPWLKRFRVPFTKNSTTSHTYTLTPCTSLACPPLQQIHRSARAIPLQLADVRCSHLETRKLFLMLQQLLGSRSNRSLSVMRPHLEKAQVDALDFGTVYARLRPWWDDSRSFREVQRHLTKREWEDRCVRAIPHDGHIRRYKIPPRRVWDLFSNRIVSNHYLNTLDIHTIPDNLWAVSHSWVDASERHNIGTTINHCEWTIPLPNDTTLDHLRIELLNMGAEYVFLDVLCLRQEGGDEMREERLREWATDIPLLGYVYRHSRFQTVVVYFNGLGRPLKIDDATLRSDTHWFNRVWTLQETVINWLPGGVCSSSLENLPDDRRRFMRRMRESQDAIGLSTVIASDSPMYGFGSCEALLQEMQRRPGYTKKAPFDRVAAVSYLMSYPSRPAYDEGWKDAEHAWRSLVSTMPPGVRVDLLVRFPWGIGSSKSSRPMFCVSWRPSWETLTSHLAYLFPGPSTRYAKDEELVPGGTGDTVYYHHAHVIQHCRLMKTGGRAVVRYFGAWSYQLGEDPSTMSPQEAFQDLIIKQQAELEENMDVTLVGVADFECWVLGRVSGHTTIGGPGDSETAIVLDKLAAGRIEDPQGRIRFKRLQLGQKQCVAYSDPGHMYDIL